MSLISLGLPQWSDQSVVILNQIIGSVQHMVDSSIPSPGDTDSAGNIVPLPLFASMMLYFNQALLGCGSVLFAIMVFIGTMNTASDGQMLGKSWHTMWTPIRLIFGLLFVVPLKSGLCIGQKIVLYAVLIGINMGTTVWKDTIDQVFNHSSQPPIPVYLNNTVTQMVEQVFLTQAVEKIVMAIPGQPLNGKVVIPVSETVIVGQKTAASAPEFVVTALNNQIAGTNGLCSQLFPDDIADCSGALNSLLTSTTITGQKYSGQNANYYIFIGSNTSQASPPVNMTESRLDNFIYNSSFTPMNWAPDGKINVSGNYTYTFPDRLLTASGSLPDCSTMAAGDVITATYCSVQALISTYVVPSTGTANPVPTKTPLPPTPCPKDPSAGTVSCSLQGPVASIMDEAQANVAISQFELAYQESGSSGNMPAPAPTTSGSDDTNTQVNTPMQPNGVPPNIYINYSACPYGTTPGSGGIKCRGEPIRDPIYNQIVYPVAYNLNDYWVPGTSSIPGQPGPMIDMQLNNSWWQAGSSYLVIDNQLSQSLAQLWTQLQTLINKIQNAGNSATFEGNFTLGYSVSVWAMGQIYPNIAQCGAYNLDWVYAGNLTPLGITNSAAQPNNVDPTASFFSCAADEIHGTNIFNVTLPVQTMQVPPTNWPQLIAPYNPDPNYVAQTTQLHVIDSTNYPDLYMDLSYLPAQYQGPVSILLTMAAQDYKTNPTKVPSDYVILMPYLQGLLNVLQANNILQSGPSEGLPVTMALNEIFSGLLGADSADPTASLNSVIQQVYNLGSPPAVPGLVAKQFSLMQQTQSVGISMIMVCITSMEDIINHFQNEYQTFESSLNFYMNAGIGLSVSAGFAASLASNPMWAPVSSALSGALSASASAMNLLMQIKTINELTSISMTLMWLPIVMFVLTSLFTAGVQFALIVPLTPYLLFWAGEIAWLLAVLEAVVAAPIVMLGLAHPGGHDYMGHSAPAVRMLLSVVFRPVLMVIGMITGILLTYVVITFSAQGFHTVAASLLNAVPQNDQLVQGILASLMLLVYCSFIVLAFNKCFSTIYTIPDKVMEWVGGHRGDQAGAQDVQSLSGTASQGADKMAGAGSQGAEKGIGTMGDKAGQTSKFDQDASSTAKSEGTGTGKGIADGAQTRERAKREQGPGSASTSSKSDDS
ncbi:MAG: DotA/TraY family protein [Gammaproteobacteria bacterium]|nr:DotA/TraY family protein [Gammaproteobacteria bacterium]